MLRLSYQTSSPLAAQSMVNAIVQAFIKRNIDRLMLGAEVAKAVFRLMHIRLQLRQARPQCFQFHACLSRAVVDIA
ncbi:hypothetical protein ACC687_39325, partial [Rhizobium ruizarguesonis]